MLFFVLLCGLAPIAAQTDSVAAPQRVTTNVRMIGLGHNSVLDTYISPEEYGGTELRYISHTLRERDGRRWAAMLVHQGYAAITDNRANEGGEMAGMYSFSYGRHRKWDLCQGRLTLRAGGMATATAGFLYNTRNGNNPAQMRLAVDISPWGMASYRLKAWGVPLTVNYEVSAPLFGVMFSPNYGQSYYEIFERGNYDSNIVPTTPFSAPSLRQMLAVDFPLLGATVRLGYLGDYRQAEVNNLKYHEYTHTVVIGIMKKFKIIKMKP